MIHSKPIADVASCRTAWIACAIVSLICTAACADDIMFHEDFEAGFSDAWLEVSSDITIVTDPDDPDNHVAALPPGKARLLGPPVRYGDWRSAQNSEEIDQWKDYELTFRLRPEHVRNIDNEEGVSGNFFRFVVRINPQEDNHWEQRHTFLIAWRPSMQFRFYGPLISWFGQMQRTEHTYYGRADYHGQFGLIEPRWYTFRIVNVGDETAIWLDDQLISHRGDERASRGGFALERWDNDPLRVDLGMIYLDDIRVRRVDASALPDKE